tara:strand:+ start:302 stop:544 length:243 start_codon:yes stop_codon:yes gene_type:complete
MGMKTQDGLMMAMAMAMINEDFGESLSEPTKEEIEHKKAIALKARNLKQGVNEYFYGVKVIYARNKKNANKKARKQGLII